MQLALSTWQEVEDYLRVSRGNIIPIGSTEQHGPNGLLGTDHLDAEFVAKGVGDKIGCLVAPTRTIGMSQHHLAFAGSVTLRPSTLIAVVGDVVHSLLRHGFERFLTINGKPRRSPTNLACWGNSSSLRRRLSIASAVNYSSPISSFQISGYLAMNCLMRSLHAGSSI
jgi:creatinine amidohydrolase